jgi:DNA replication protein DnaC
MLRDVTREPTTLKPDNAICVCGQEIQAYPLFGKWRQADECHWCYTANEISSKWAQQPRYRPMFGVPHGHSTCTLDNYKCPPGSAAAREIAQEWQPETGRGLLFWGEPGHGKSHLAFALARSLSEQRRPIVLPRSIDAEDKPPVIERLKRIHPDGMPIYQHRVEAVSVAVLLGEMRRRFSVDRGAEDIIDRLILCDVLVLDDLGAENASDWAQEQLFLIFDCRLAENKPNIITTNFSLGQLSRHYGKRGELPAGKRIASRLMGACEIVPVNAKADYRDRRRSSI